MRKAQVIKNWLTKAQSDVKAAKDLFNSGHFDWCLFVWHLAIEKALKAKIISLNKDVIYTHDLRRLASKTDIKFTKTQLEQLDEITSFNIEARYDDYKLSFYKKANKDYARRWSKICESLYSFILKSI